MAGIQPRQSPVFTWSSNRHRLASGKLQGENLAGNVFPNSIDELFSRICGRLVMVNRLRPRGVGKSGRIWRPDWVGNADIILRDDRLAAISQRAHNEFILVVSTVVSPGGAHKRDTDCVARRDKVGLVLF